VTAAPLDFSALYARLGTIAAMPVEQMLASSDALAAEMLGIAERILEIWVSAHGGVPTDARKEGFRLLALHAQGTRGEPSFNACRETCREIVFQHNVVAASANDEERTRALRLMIMVVRHLSLFISGKLEVAGLGEFCCASKPLRRAGEGRPAAAVA
jgi:hypothetical protein